MGFSLSVTKRVTRQKAKLQNFISENFLVSRTQETSIEIFTRAAPLVARKMVNFAPKTSLGLVHVRADGWAYTDVITKFSRMDRLPTFLSEGGLFARA